MEFHETAKIEAWKLVTEKKERFTNLIITLSVGAIGFSIIQIVKEPLLPADIFLGLSCILWSLCIWISFRNLEKSHDLILKNVGVLRLQNKSELTDDEKANLKKLESDFNILDELIVGRLKLIEYIFLLGVLLFIVWAAIYKLK